MEEVKYSTRCNAFIELGLILGDIANDKSVDIYNPEYHKAIRQLQDLILNSKNYNTWFTEDNVRYAFSSLSSMLLSENIEKWTNKYSSLERGDRPVKTIAVIMAGNIPVVGFHDFLSVLISGNKFYGKLSAKDQKLLPAIAELLICIETGFSPLISFTTERMSGFDAVIATGSSSSALYFDYYFSKYPNIIRENRNSLAVLSGNETKDELSLLADDIFKYFGLGCRNVSKIFVPKDYSFELFFQEINRYEFLKNHFSYKNNYDHNKAIFLINSKAHLDNGFLLLREEEKLYSPLSVIHYEYYDDIEEVNKKVDSLKNQLQCVVAGDFYKGLHIYYGETQSPQLWDYADGVDMLSFLEKL